MSIERTMYEEALKEYDEIGRMELGSEQYVKTVQGANSIVDRLNETDRVELDKRKLEVEEEKIKLEQCKLENEKQDRFWRNIITIGTFVAGAGITIWANVDSKRFELEGTHTTEAGRTSQRKLLSFWDKMK